MLKDRLKIPHHDTIVPYEVINLVEEKETLYKKNQRLTQKNLRLAYNLEQLQLEKSWS